MSETGKGFALDCGDPVKAKYALMLEAPGRDEIAYRLLDPKPYDLARQTYDREEYARRSRYYPDIPEQFRKRGMALVGKSWGIMASWCFRKFGLKREDFYIGNVLRCFPPRSPKGDQYPTGETRKKAELCCRQYDPVWVKYAPRLGIITIHPAALTRSITPLPLLIRSVEKLRDCGEQGLHAVLLCGGKSVKLWLGYYDSVTRFQGHYGWFKPGWYTEVLTRLKKNAGEAEPKARSKKATTGKRYSRRGKSAKGMDVLLGE